MAEFLQLGKEAFHKSQAFDFKGNLAVVNLEKPGIGGKILLGQSPTKNTSVYPKGLGGDKPAWVAFDKQVKGIKSGSHSLCLTVKKSPKLCVLIAFIII